MIYTALGDSITFGESASSFENAYPQLAVSALNSKSRKTEGRVLARSGWNSGDLLRALMWRGTPMIRDASVVSVWIGGVDLAKSALFSYKLGLPIPGNRIVTNYRSNFSAILEHIRRNSSARIVCCTQYNPFPNSSLAVEWIGRLNGLTSEIAHSYDAQVVPCHKWFEGRQAELIYGYRNGMVEDALGGFYPIHPNDRGHRVIAKGLVPYLGSR